MKHLFRSLAVILLSFMGACSPNFVEGEAFSIEAGTSELRTYDDANSIVLYAQEGDTIRTAVLYVPNNVVLKVGASIPLAASSDQAGLVKLELTVGDAVVEEFGGEYYVSADDSRSVDIRKGTVTFDSLVGVTSGMFEARMVDGSEITGAFSAEGSMK